MPPRKKPTLLAQGKPRTLGGTKRAWRVRLYAPGEGSTSYQVMFRSPTGDGQPWERVLRRATTETEARNIFTRALLGTKIRVAGFGGLRLGEQNALRAIDVFFDGGYLHVNGSWTTPRHQPGYRGPVKNHVLHEVPLPGTLLREELLPRVKELLGLPPTATLQQVINTQEAERQRRADLAVRALDRNLAWWNYPIPPEAEQWLFVDIATGLPVKPELHNNRWHRVRAWVDQNDPDNAWPRTIVYRNLRHHAATRWFREELGESWEVVAQYLGDKLTTVLNHYVRAGEDALRDSVSKLAER